ncbi:putative fimbrial protein [Yersinia frederiksenii]|uniref:Type 1 fimbrial protein n=1 Tax=Yersinia alsatica TaxID=2890317 RepID=A0ABY5UJH1_9GAMM|nr:fimbrial protein [Yersinia alsatica]OVZ91123.1 fimbrial protein [Yersinia frederiksenii]OWF67098.1 fimbrial protein [Yersinia frederiksenii]OWF75422.1 fimbrial protein [Yersinia frederiksenii]UWM43616.1 type 1 fimbrial protein [Yersinia alsatica]CFQ62634.1 putative fimbrial protein [Yersinia frederiksenii]
MKKLAIIASVVAAFTGINAAQAASTGTINFTGELTASTCNVSVDGQGAEATVVLPTVSTSQLTTANQVAGSTGFNMALSNCSGTLKTVSAFFEAGPSVDLVTGHLKNVSGDAGMVSLELLDGSNAMAPIKAGNTSQAISTTYVNAASGSATLPYAVQYYADGETTPGTVISNVVYSIQYK